MSFFIGHLILDVNRALLAPFPAQKPASSTPSSRARKERRSTIGGQRAPKCIIVVAGALPCAPIPAPANACNKSQHEPKKIKIASLTSPCRTEYALALEGGLLLVVVIVVIFYIEVFGVSVATISKHVVHSKLGSTALTQADP